MRALKRQRCANYCDMKSIPIKGSCCHRRRYVKDCLLVLFLLIQLEGKAEPNEFCVTNISTLQQRSMGPRGREFTTIALIV